MYLVMAYGLGVLTLVMVLALLWLGWQHRRDEARRDTSARSVTSTIQPKAWSVMRASLRPPTSA